MNRTFTKFLVLALLVATSLTACKKDNDTLTVTKENLAAAYTLVSVKVKAGNNPEEDRTNDAFDEPCEKDDQIVLKSDFTATYVDAGTQCSPAGGGSGTWSLTGNTIEIEGETFTVKSLTQSSLVLEQSSSVAGYVIKVTYIYSRR